MNIKIHTATLSDVTATYPMICQLSLGGWDGSGGEVFPTFENYSEAYEKILSDPNKRYLIAKSGDVTAGVIGMSLNVSLVESGLFAHIEELVVDKTFHRMGVGQKLLAACIDTAKSEGCSCITLTTGSKRYAAQSLYEKTGFEKIGIKYVMEF